MDRTATEALRDLGRGYRRIAPFYDLLDLPLEYGRYGRVRPLLFRELAGKIFDAGVGTGRNVPFYPAGANVVGVDLSPAMLAAGGAAQTACFGKRRTGSFDVEHGTKST